jgi:hypothetical protein
VDDTKEEEDDEEADLIRRLAKIKGGSNVSTSSSQLQEAGSQDKSKNVQGATLTLVDSNVMNSTLSNLAEKLYEEKEREDQFRQAAREEQDEQQKQQQQQQQQENSGEIKAQETKDQVKHEHNPNTVDVEIILGKKLFYPNTEAKKKKKKQKVVADKIEDMALKQFLESRFGFGHNLNTSFNYAVRELDAQKIENYVKSNSSFALSEQRLVIYGRIRLNTKRSNVVLAVDSKTDSNGLHYFKMLEFYDRSARLVLIDFIRPEKERLDYRVLSRYYSHTQPPAQIVELIEKRARWSKEKDEVVILPAEEKPTETSADGSEKPKADRFNLVADRIKSESIYINGPFKVIIAATKDPLKDSNKTREKKKEKKELANAQEDEQKEVESTLHEDEDEDDDDMKRDGERRLIESIEVTITSSKLAYDAIKDPETNLKNIHSMLYFVNTDLLGAVQL